MSRPTVIALVACCLIGLVPSSADAQTYEQLIRAYRRGEFDSAVMVMSALIESAERRREREDWLNLAVKEQRGADLAAALMLHTEVAFSRVAFTGPPESSNMPVHFVIVDFIYDALRPLPDRRTFLRNWYLLWESLRQSNPVWINRGRADYLRRGLDMFPDDSELLLAMGARYELAWWALQENSHHRVDGGGSAESLLRSARDYLRKSSRSPQPTSETNLRLSRVLTLLGELDAASAELERFKTVREGPVLQYLGLLFEGDLLERRGNLTAAARAYDQAVALVGVPQSALIARAHLAYVLGERRDAAAAVVTAMGLSEKQSDPWWWYIRGMSWRAIFYLDRGRRMVRQ